MEGCQKSEEVQESETRVSREKEHSMRGRKKKGTKQKDWSCIGKDRKRNSHPEYLRTSVKLS